MAEFIQRTPLGIIMNRLSYDINIIDNDYANAINASIPFFLVIVTDIWIFSIGIKDIISLLPAFTYILVAFWMRNKYMSAQREIRRLQAITKSPIIGLSSASIQGGPVIRSLAREEYFSQKLEQRINENTKNVVLGLGLTKWFQVIMSVWDFFILLIPLYSLVVFTLYNNYVPDPTEKQKDEQIDLSNFILSAISFAGTFYIALDYICSIELLLVSVERCKTFEDLDSEKGYKGLQFDKKVFSKLNTKIKKAELIIKTHQTPEIFKSGDIVFKNVTAKYPAAKRPVLLSISTHIESGQRIGIVGRTGAGKSSFTKLIWRSMDPIIGSIKIDGIDIANLDLKNLREQLNIVLQKPTLFEGTIASNISAKPLTSSQLVEVRRDLIELGFPEAKLKEEGLGYAVEASGANLSQSEKQILSMVRALQKKSKIVILDEATAYVDVGMEKKFQKMVLSRFEGSTVLIIAHRVSNVMDCDRILVFDDGHIVEDGPVEELLSDRFGVFYQIWMNR